MKKFIPIFLSVCIIARGAASCNQGAGTLPCSAHPAIYTVTCPGGTGVKADFDAVRDDAQLGDTLEIPPTCTYSGSLVLGEFEATFAFKKAIPGSSGYFTVTTTEHAKLPPDENVRITPAHASLMPIIQDYPSSISQSVAFWSGANPPKHIKLRGLNLRVHPSYTRTVDSYPVVDIGGTQYGYTNVDKSQYSALTVGAGNTAGSSTLTMTDTTGMLPGMRLYLSARNSGSGVEYVYISTVDSSTQVTLTTPLVNTHVANRLVIAMVDGPEFTPDDIWISQCYINAPWFSHKSRGISVNGRNIKLTGNFINGFMRYGNQEAQGIFGVHGIGPFTVTNNWIQGNSENVIFGGAMPAFDNVGVLMGANQSIWKHNAFAKIREQEWIGTYSSTISAGDIVWAGRHVLVPGSGSVWMKATNTGIAGDPPTISTVIGSQALSGTVLWEVTGASNKPNAKNTFEIKDGENFLLNENYHGEWQYMTIHNTTQPSAVNFKAANQGCPDDLAVWPQCHRSANWNMTVQNSFFDMHGGSWVSILGCYVGPCARYGNLTLRNNLLVSQGGSLEYFLFLGASKDYAGNHVNPHDGPFVIEHNTSYSPTKSTNGALYTEYSGTAPGYYPRNDNVTRYNIFPGGNSTYPVRSGRSTIDEHDKKWFGCDYPCTSTQLHKNFAAGNALYGSGGGVSAVADSFRTGCPTNTSGCLASDAWNRDYGEGLLFRNHLSEDFRIRPAHTWARNTLTGQPIGADLTKIPKIMNLTATPTDTAVVLSYKLSNPIKNVPCVAEIHGAPDFLSTTFNGASGLAYSGELSNISTYYDRPYDNYDGVPRYGNTRYIVFGQDEPLTEGTRYFYRLQCAGALKRGEFTTTGALSSTTVKTIRRVVNRPTVATMDVQYGTAYSATTDTISSGGTESASCTVNTLCSVPLTLNKGDVVYWRWVEKAAGGAVLRTGKVSIIPVT
jgi:hypothetical protein